MGWRIRQNGPAHAWYTIHVYIFEWAGGFCGVGPGVPSPRERVPSRKSPQPARIYTHVWCIMHALVHFGECANPFWRMRLSILANVFFYLMFYIKIPFSFIDLFVVFNLFSYRPIQATTQNRTPHMNFESFCIEFESGTSNKSCMQILSFGAHHFKG